MEEFPEEGVYYESAKGEVVKVYVRDLVEDYRIYCSLWNLEKGAEVDGFYLDILGNTLDAMMKELGYDFLYHETSGK